MMRITKDPAERRQELIDVAEQLFMEKGYGQTAISDIVKKLKVAQGTFYYYFQSKDDILDAVVEKNVSILKNSIKHLIGNGNSDPAIRLNEAINGILEFVIPRKEVMNYIHQDINAAMHARLERVAVEHLIPILSDIVAEGNQQGRFRVNYPRETAEFLIAAIVYLFHRPQIYMDQQHCERLCRTLEMILEKTLEVDSFKFELKI
jgi:AcrR family transcriptional regulator